MGLMKDSTESKPLDTDDTFSDIHFLGEKELDPLLIEAIQNFVESSDDPESEGPIPKGSEFLISDGGSGLDHRDLLKITVEMVEDFPQNSSESKDALSKAERMLAEISPDLCLLKIVKDMLKDENKYSKDNSTNHPTDHPTKKQSTTNLLNLRVIPEKSCVVSVFLTEETEIGKNYYSFRASFYELTLESTQNHNTNSTFTVPSTVSNLEFRH